MTKGWLEFLRELIFLRLKENVYLSDMVDIAVDLSIVESH